MMDRKEAIEVVKKNWPYSRHQLSEALLTLIPELKENEDENLRKGLIEHLKELKGQSVEGSNLKRPEHYDAWIAWLEKKDDKKLAETCKGISPKYKAGDWIICCDCEPEQIICVRTDAYEMSNGDIRPFYMIDDNDNIRPWTVQDAKDGDILVMVEDGKPDEQPFIFKGFLDKFHPDCPVAYGGIEPGGTFDISSGDGWWDSGTEMLPAGKELRDLLFKKMKEAGYEWDAEKKKLIPLETADAKSDAKVGDNMGKTDNEVLDLCKSWFEDIMERSGRLTSGNVSHGSKAIRGVAKNYAEYVDEHLRNRWKPSTEQMQALHLAVDDSWVGKRLRSLCADLKKVYGSKS